MNNYVLHSPNLNLIIISRNRGRNYDQSVCKTTNLRYLIVSIFVKLNSLSMFTQKNIIKLNDKMAKVKNTFGTFSYRIRVKHGSNSCGNSQCIMLININITYTMYS